MFRRDLALSADGRAFVPRGALDLRDVNEPQTLGLHRFDFERAKLVLRRNRWLIVSCLAVAVVAAILLTAVSTRIYSASASVQLEQQSARVVKNDELNPESSVADAERFLQTQIDVLNSHALALRVADRLQLARDTAFLDRMGERFTATGAPEERVRRLRDRVVTVLRSNLRISLPRNSRLAVITYSSRDRDLAAQIANAYAEALITDNLERRYRASAYARNFLQDQLGLAKTKLEVSERAAIDYARSADLIDTGAQPGVSSDHGRTLITSSLISMNETLNSLTAERIRTQERWARAQHTPLMSLPDVLSNQAIQELARSRAELSAAYQKELEQHLPDHPSVQQAKAELDETNSQMMGLAGSIRDSIHEGYEVSLQQERLALANINRLRAGTLAEQQRSVQYGILRREVDTNRELYDGLLQRYKEVGAAAGITANNISIVDVAEAPFAPSWPKPILNVAIALFLGALAAAGLIFMREAVDDAVRTPDDIESKIGTTLLGTIPRVTGPLAPVEALEGERSMLAESYSSLRTALEFTGDAGVPRRLLVTSSQTAEGKSLTSYAIARSFALAGRRVLLVDGDLRRPSLAKLLGIEQETGFSSVLNGTAQVAENIVALPVANLFFLPSGALPPNPADLYGRPQARKIIEHLSDEFDLVVIDGPPVLGLADAPLLAATVEGTVFLIDASRSHRGRIKTALRRLQRAHGRVFGVVLTMFNPRHAGYSDYGYNYEYRPNLPSRLRIPALIADRF